MRTGILLRLRNRRRTVVRWLVAAILLPLALGLLPQPALTAEQALERDLAGSQCGPGAIADNKGDRAPHHQQCIVSAFGCSVAGPPARDGTPAAATLTERRGNAVARERRIGQRRSVAIASGHPPRGPPSA